MDSFDSFLRIPRFEFCKTMGKWPNQGVRDLRNDVFDKLGHDCKKKQEQEKFEAWSQERIRMTTVERIRNLRKNLKKNCFCAAEEEEGALAFN